MNKRIYIPAILLFVMAACGKKEHDFDASGTFETDDVVVSSELGGKILSFQVEEGDSIPAGKTVGEVDAENTRLQKEQVEESIRSSNPCRES
jgi:HlyD family secretion protein